MTATMDLGVIGVFDLSDVTQTLIDEVKAAWPPPPTWNQRTTPTLPQIGGQRPDRAVPGINIYLYHLREDRALEFRPPVAAVAGPGASPIASRPLSLTLYYLVSVDLGANQWAQEQSALSIVMRTFFGQPAITRAQGTFTWRADLHLESRSEDELSRLWQAFATPLRTSAVYSVTVLLVPDVDETSARNPSRVNVVVVP